VSNVTNSERTGLIAGRSRLRAFIRSERGTAIIETAMTLPLLLMVSVGIFEFGRGFQTWQVLTNAAREGARVAVLPNVVAGAAEARVRQYMASGQLPNAANATVTLNPTATVSYGAGTASASVVTVDYPFEFMVLQPVARMLVSGSTLGGPLTIRASAQMRNESQ
jgi:Flp pilus assembly protein TadG